MISDDIWNFDTSPQTCSSLGPYKLFPRCRHHLITNMSIENTHILFFTYLVKESFLYPYFSRLTKLRPWSDSGAGLGSLKMESFTVPRPLILGQVKIDQNETKKTKRPLALMGQVTQYWDWPWMLGLNDWEFLIVRRAFTFTRSQLLSNQRL